jgi:hypothetical protein
MKTSAGEGGIDEVLVVSNRELEHGPIYQV